MHTYMIHTYIRIYISLRNVYTYIHRPTFILTYEPAYVHAIIHRPTYIHAYTYKFIHTYMHTYIIA